MTPRPATVLLQLILVLGVASYLKIKLVNYLAASQRAK